MEGPRRWRARPHDTEPMEDSMPDKPTCSIDGCTRVIHSRGWCHAHYKRWWRNGRPDTPHAMLMRGATPEERFRASLKRAANGCLEFTGSINRYGYGNFHISGTAYGKDRKRTGAHRFAYALAFGEIPAGMAVCHRCDNPPCCEPTHLFLGNVSQNNRDKHRKGRDARGLSHGMAKLTPDAVRMIRARYIPRDPLHNLTAIARELGVTKHTVQQVASGHTWRHVQ